MIFQLLFVNLEKEKHWLYLPSYSYDGSILTQQKRKKTGIDDFPIIRDFEDFKNEYKIARLVFFLCLTILTFRNKV